MTWNEFAKKANKLYWDEKYEEAYQLVIENRILAKGNEAEYYNMQFCFACRAGQPKLALELLQATIDQGYWYSYDYLLKEEDLAALWNDDKFQELAMLCNEREQEAIRNTLPKRKVLYPKKEKKETYPLLLALHGNGQNISKTEEAWAPCMANRAILAMLQSSQVIFSNHYTWQDLGKGSDELKRHYEELLMGSGIDKERVIVGGFSGGTRISLYSVLKGNIDVRGFILIGPWLPEIAEWEPMFDHIKSAGIKGYIICGAKDEVSLESANQLITYLEKKQIDYKYQLIPDVDHSYPDDFGYYLQDALDYILN